MEKNYNKIIGNNLSRLRKQKKLTQLELANKFNFSDKTISKWESGESLPNIEILCKLAEYYSMADAFVTFSTAETFGKVSAEAMACGTPVVCHNATACPEILGDGCGYAVEIGDLQGFADALDEIYKNGKEHYSNNCVAHTRTTFEKSTLTNEYIELYSQLCEEK